MRKLTRLRALPATLALIAVLGTLFAAAAIADGISNALDSSVDAAAESMSLVPGGPNGTTELYLSPRGGDGKDGCNILGNTQRLVADVRSDDPAVATVSPGAVVFDNCGDRPRLTVTPRSEGRTAIRLTQVSNSTEGTFDFAPATFDVNVGSAADTPPPSAPSAPSAPPGPEPVAGETFVANPVAGKVAFKCKGDEKKRGLKETKALPVGCLIDARGGKVRITSAANGSSTKTKAAVFSQGQFKVREKRSRRPVTELRLAGNLVGCSRATAADGPVRDARRRSRRGRRLWGRGRGRFRTRGRRSSASVRGTTWLVEDRCDGSTLTKVRSGKVRVRDFVKKKTVTVKKGRSYVAKPRKRRQRS